MVFHETQIYVMKNINISWNIFMSQLLCKSQSKASMNLSVLVEI